jgi:hypothetical protein
MLWSPGLICFLFGFWSIIAQILLFVWTQLSGNRKTAIAVSCLGAFCLLPWIAFIFAPLVNGLSSVRANEADEEDSFGTFGDDPVAFPRTDSGYRMSGVGRSPREVLHRPSFPRTTPVIRSPTARSHLPPHSPLSLGDNRTKSSASG